MAESADVSGLHVVELVKILEVTGDSRPLDFIEAGTTSCIEWATSLQRLTNGAIRREIFLRTQKALINDSHFKAIEQALKERKSVYITVLLPEGNHGFVVQGLENDKACILHAWQGKHQVRAENPQSVSAIVNLMKQLKEHDVNSREAEIVRSLLWGPDNAEPSCSAGIQRISFEAVFAADPVEPLTSPSNRETLDNLLRAWATQHVIVPNLYRTDSNALLGFVLSAGEVVDSWLESGKVDWGKFNKGRKGSLAGTLPGTTVGFAGNATIQLGARSLVIPAGKAVTGKAQFGIFEIWDVYEWKMQTTRQEELRRHEKLRKHLASKPKAVAGTAGRLPGARSVGGALGTLGVATVANLVATQDDLTWDGSEESVMTSYAFFGFHDVEGNEQNEYPKYNHGVIAVAYEKKQKNKPDGVDKKCWKTVCLGYLVILLGAMFPAYKKLLRMAADLKKNKSKNLPFICANLYEQSQDPRNEAVLQHRNPSKRR